MSSRRYGALAKFAFLVVLTGYSYAQDAAPSTATAPLRVLFIGNSLTYANSLPKMLADVTAQSSEGRKIESEEVTFPAWNLVRHWDAGKALKVIRMEHWDFVVLQPAFADLQGKAIELFDAEIRKSGAKTIVYVTFARFGTADLRADQYYDRQEQSASAVGALSARVGPAWSEAIKAGISPHTLYDMDGLHPSALGTYLAACVFFSVIYSRSPEDLRPPPWIQGVHGPDIDALNSAAWRAVRKAP